jgi:hypothetical protein
MKNLQYIFCAAFFCISIVNSAGAQNKPDKKAAKIAAIAAIVDSKNFVFDADSEAGRTLNNSYNLTVSQDTVTASLPYNGESHTSLYGSTDGDLNFKWTKCAYKVAYDDKGNKEISITPTDFTAKGANVVQLLQLYIAANGYAVLRVNSVNHSIISFTGTIQKGHPNAQASLVIN